MNGIIGSLVFLIVALYLLYYLIERMVVGKWTRETFRDNAVQIVLVIALFIFSIVFYLGRHPTY